MSDFNRGYARTIPADRADMSVDAGLRSFMLGVYNKLALGLVVAAVTAWVSANYPPVTNLLYRTIEGHLAGVTPLGWIVAFAPVVLILASNFLMRNPTDRSASLLYWAVVVLMGASLGLWLLVYTGASAVFAFVVTAAGFAGLSLWGYTTKRDLGPLASFLIVGLIGLVITFVIGAFVPSLGGAIAGNTGFGLIINLIALLIFSGLVAYKTQALKLAYYQAGGSSAALGPLTSFGALTLFISFVNMFLTILRLTGSRR